MPHIGEVIRKARTRLNLTAADVAAGCNVARSQVYRWEKEGYVFPKNFPALSSVLKVPMRKLRQTNGESPSQRG
jgi:transcriptional regulator with XRE-family HTH domain